jgi:hypothetical protein
MKFIITMVYAAILAISACSSVKAQTMTPHQANMLEIENQRLQLQREALAEQKLTGLYVRCGAIRINSLQTLAGCVHSGGKVDAPIASAPSSTLPQPTR